ncbi:MAG: hypothetical protein A3J46_02380 [Candidatus Yanofskybacteria bacterium RIFCSPHIGHO2_02_FULL_41_11]|uniref:Uncharacterized protein n=1 Tax=Candidatus Yanofskybacteria bacterium RIFCSPHIGHO2_02_FULL_41_11 TaxID=1802675 RepID=A0A1F8F8V8_9BACT|nr:MAG: hypothetical protein A3J46_02380 [Candidatus Yanofskybacteria bacterium RIFCSPHIGHO2_02_FULL_41_11]
MDEEQREQLFEYINSDPHLLIFHTLLQGYYTGQGVFTLDQFIKSNYDSVEEIIAEMRDTSDYNSPEDLIWNKLKYIIEGLNMGKIRRVSILDVSGLPELVLEQAMKIESPTKDDTEYFASVINDIYDLKKLNDEQVEKVLKRKGARDYFMSPARHRVNLETNAIASKHIGYLSSLAPSRIEIELTFIDYVAKEVHQEIEDYIISFSMDSFLEKVPTYRPKRYYFSKQLENFFGYISKLPVIDGVINIPFSALNEQGFEVVKILSYLETERRAKVSNWLDTEFWNVKFHITPITLASLLGQENKPHNKVTDQKLKLNLSFSPKTGTMQIKDQDGKEYKIKVQGQVQKEVIRVIFLNPENIYEEWSLYDISELLGGSDDVNETAVKNAIYQFNRKVKLEIPQVENLFNLTKHSAQLNPKYVSKN